MLQSISYLPCTYTKSEFDDEDYQADIYIDLGIINNERFELFTMKKYIHPIDNKKALLTVEVIEINNGIAVIYLPGSELVSGRSVVHLPFHLLQNSL